MTVELRSRLLKNGNKTLYLDFYEKGRRWYEYLDLYIVPGNSPAVKKQNEGTMNKAIAIKAKRILGIEDEPEPAANGELPKRVFADWLDGYYKRLVDEDRLSESSLENVDSCIKVVKSYLAYKHRPRLLMKKIDKKFLVDFFDYLQHIYKNNNSPDNPKPLSPRTCLAYQHQLTHILNDAVSVGVLSANPFYSLKDNEKVAEVPTSRDYLTKEELELMASAETKNQLAKQAFMFACFTGLRYSDISSLMWGNIQHTSLGQEIVIDSMQKTKHSVRIPLSNIALSWLPERGNNAASQKVFVGLTSLCQTNVLLKKMAKSVGIDKNLSFHVSRHTFATSAIAAGGDLYTVCKLLGHKDIQTTQVYADVIMPTRIDAVNRLSDFFWQSVSTSEAEKPSG